MKINSGHTAAICSALFIGLSYMFMKVGLGYVSMNLLLAQRFTLGFILFGFITLFIKIGKLTIKDYIKLMPLGIISPLFTFYLQGNGLRFIGSSEAGVITALAPVMTMILASLLLKEKPKFIQIIGTFISVTGVIMIFMFKGTNFGPNSIAGIISVTLSVLGFVIIGILVKQLIKTYTFIQIAFVSMTVGSIGFNLNYFISDGSLSAYIDMSHPPVYFLSLIYLSSFATVFSVLASNYSLSKLSANQFSIFSNLTPVISIVAGTLILKEPFSFIQGIGTVMVITGVIAANYQGSSQNLVSMHSDMQACLNETP